MVMILTLYCRDLAQRQKELDNELKLAQQKRQLAELRWQEVEKTKAAVEKQEAALEKNILLHQIECGKLDKMLQKSDNFCLQFENLKLREEKVVAREKEIKEFRRHGKGARSAA